MSSTASLLQEWLLRSDRRTGLPIDAIGSAVDLDRLAAAHVRLARRFAMALGGFEIGDQGVSALDVAILLRQIIRTFQRRFQIPTPLWKLISQLDHRAGLSATFVSDGIVEVAAEPWTTDWLAHTEAIDKLEIRRKYEPAMGNGPLLSAYGHFTYQSEAQKAAVEACQFSEPGSTTLITLPTGGGKSLCAVLPAWIRSKGGSKRGGTTIVIVPTVALALDQYASAIQYFEHARGPEYQPQCWRGDTTLEERRLIQEGVENGTIPLLFTSPESLMLSSLKHAVVVSAKRDNLSHFVVDEAHIVKSWGAQFRAEFQLLAAFLRELYAASNSRLCTILLSATVDQDSEDLLKHLFDFGSFTMIRANAVRPEPSWWFSWSDHVLSRQRRVTEALYYLPRPAILYVTSPDDADAWAERLRDIGFRRVEAFSGRTGDTDRDSLLKRWRGDDIDIMVATSAFGLGVDKTDVRTVLHACLPETLDRFYQEVGRGGRDGNSCVSLVCAVGEDLDTAIGLTSASHISTEKAVSRWLGMRRTARIPEESSSLISVDVNAPPVHDLNMGQGPRNREWNMHTLLLLQRAEFLEITNAALPHTLLDGLEEDRTLAHRIGLRAFDVEALQGAPDYLFAALDPIRQQERKRVTDHAVGMNHLVLSNVSPYVGRAECVSLAFARLYPDCALACGGCPSCRSEGRAPYTEQLDFLIDQHEAGKLTPAPRLEGEFAATIGSRARLTIIKPDNTQVLVELVASLVHAGVIQLIVHGSMLTQGSWSRELIRELSVQQDSPHLIVPDHWLKEHGDIPLRNLPTAVIYPGADGFTDELYQSFRSRWARHPSTTPVFHVIEEGAYLQSESGKFVDRVPGIVVHADTVVHQLQATKQEWF